MFLYVIYYKSKNFSLFELKSFIDYNKVQTDPLQKFRSIKVTEIQINKRHRNHEHNRKFSALVGVDLKHKPERERTGL